MEKETRELLEEVTVDRLTKSLENGDDDNESFEEAIKAASKLIELEKLEAEKEAKTIVNQLEHDKLEAEKEARIVDDEFRKKEASNNRKIQIATFAAGMVIAPVVDLVCKKSLTKFIGTIEQMEYFTSSAGKSISSWFRFKK